MKPITAPYPTSLTRWLCREQRGMSAEAIVQTITDLNINHDKKFAPMDMSDVSRCIRLLREVPELEPHFHLMLDVSSEWKYLLTVWDDLVALWDDESIQYAQKCERARRIMRT